MSEGKTTNSIIDLLSLVPIENLSYQVLGSAVKSMDVGEHKTDITFSTQIIKAGDVKTVHGYVIWVEDEAMLKAHEVFNSMKEKENE